jgi:hypothetical protein
VHDGVHVGKRELACVAPEGLFDDGQRRDAKAEDRVNDKRRHRECRPDSTTQALIAGLRRNGMASGLGH